MSVSSPVRSARAPRRALRALAVLAVLAAPAALAAPAQALDYGGGGSDRPVTSVYPRDYALVSTRYGTTTQRATTFASISTPCGRRAAGAKDAAAPFGQIAYTRTVRGVKLEVRLTITGATGRGFVRATGTVRGRKCSRRHAVRVAAPSQATGSADPAALRYGLVAGREDGYPLAFATFARTDGRQSTAWESRTNCSPSSQSAVNFFTTKGYRPRQRLSLRDAYRFSNGTRGSGVTRLSGTIDAGGALRGTVRERYRVTGGELPRARCDTGTRKFAATPVA